MLYNEYMLILQDKMEFYILGKINYTKNNLLCYYVIK